MTKPTAFSYSRLNAFEQCPKKFHATSISKHFKEEETPAMSEGKRVHKALELFVKDGKPLPSDLVHLTALAARLRASPGQKFTEYQMAVDVSFVPTSWFSKDTYCRAIADLAITSGDQGAVFDYKTGKMSSDFLQMRLTGAVFFQHAPEVQRLQLAYVWLKNGKVTKETMHRSEIPDVWSELLPKINKYQAAFAKEEFPARPGWLCKRCPVTTCPYWSASR